MDLKLGSAKLRTNKNRETWSKDRLTTTTTTTSQVTTEGLNDMSTDPNTSSDFQTDVYERNCKEFSLKSRKYKRVKQEPPCTMSESAEKHDCGNFKNENDNELPNRVRMQTGVFENSEPDMKKCEACGKETRTWNYHSHLVWCLKRFGRDGASCEVKRARAEKEPCYVCKEDLSGMAVEDKTRHINWCLDNMDNSSSSTTGRPGTSTENIEILLLDCPLCGRIGETAAWKISHVKRCAKKRNMTTRQLQAALELQKRQAEERRMAGLAVAPQKHRLLRKQGSGPRRRRPLEPQTLLQADIQIAMACSLSLREEEKRKDPEENLMRVMEKEAESQERALASALGRESAALGPVSKHKNGKKKEAIPVLLLRTKEDRAAIIARRLEAVLEKTNVDSDVEDWPFIINWKKIRSQCSSQTPAKSESRLWNLAALSDDMTSDPDAFYVSKLNCYFKPNTFVAGKNMKRLSQVPGYGLTTAIAAEPDSLPSTIAMLEGLYDRNVSSDVSQLPNHSELPDDTNDLICNDGFFTQASTINVQSKDSSQTFGNHFPDMVDNEMLSDAKIIVGDGSVISCHKFMLYVRCRLLYEEAIEHHPNRKDEGVLNWPYVSRDATIAFLQFVYTGKIICWADPEEVLQLANRYNMTDLVSYMSTQPHLLPFSLDTDDLDTSECDMEINTGTTLSSSEPTSVVPAPGLVDRGPEKCTDDVPPADDVASNLRESCSALSPVLVSHCFTTDSLSDISHADEAFCIQETDIKPSDCENVDADAEQKDDSSYLALKAKVANLYSEFFGASTETSTEMPEFATSPDKLQATQRNSMSPDLFDSVHGDNLNLSANRTTSSSSFASSQTDELLTLPNLVPLQITGASVGKEPSKERQTMEPRDKPTSVKLQKKNLPEEISSVRHQESSALDSKPQSRKSVIDISSLEVCSSVPEFGYARRLRTYTIPKKKLKVEQMPSPDIKQSSTASSMSSTQSVTSKLTKTYGKSVRSFNYSSSQSAEDEAYDSTRRETLTYHRKDDSTWFSLPKVSQIPVSTASPSEKVFYRSKSPGINQASAIPQSSSPPSAEYQVLALSVHSNEGSGSKKRKLKKPHKVVPASSLTPEFGQGTSEMSEPYVSEISKGLHSLDKQFLASPLSDQPSPFHTPKLPSFGSRITNSCSSNERDNSSGWQKRLQLDMELKNEEYDECRLPDLDLAAATNYLPQSDDETDKSSLEGARRANPKSCLKDVTPPKRDGKSKSKKRHCENDQIDEPATPMPRYSIMPTPHVQKELKKIGVRQLPKKKAVKLLKHVFSETHPGHPVTSSSHPDAGQGTLTRHHSAGDRVLAPEKLCSDEACGDQTSSRPFADKKKKKKSKAAEKEPDNFTTSEMKSKPLQLSAESLYQALNEFLNRHESWKTRILEYEPADIGALYSDLKEDGFRCELGDLKDELDRQGITYTSRQGVKKHKKKKKS